MTPLYYIGAIVLVGVIVVLLYGYVRRLNRPKPNEEEKLKKQFKEAGQKLRKLKETAKPIPSPPPIPPPIQPQTNETQGEITSLAEFPIGQKIGIDLSRIKDGTNTRIIVARGKVKIKGRDPRKLLFFLVANSAYYINPKKIIKVIDKKGKVSFKLVYDILYAEALNQDGNIEWDDELEMILADSGLDQYVMIAAYEGGFLLTPTIKTVMIILGALGFFIGLAINGATHVIPTTIIHWVP